MLALLAKLWSGINLKDWLYGGVIAALVGAFTWYTLHEQSLGAQKIKAQDAIAAAKEQQHDSTVEANAARAITALSASYNAVLAAPLPAPTAAPVIVCHSAAPRASAVPHPASPASGNHAAADVQPAVPEAHTANIGPADEKLHQDADAQVVALQAYIHACEAAKLCK